MKVKGNLTFGANAAAGELQQTFVQQIDSIADLSPNTDSQTPAVSSAIGQLFYCLNERIFVYSDGTRIIPFTTRAGVYRFDTSVDDIGGSAPAFYEFEIRIPKSVIFEQLPSGTNELSSLSANLIADITYGDYYGAAAALSCQLVGRNDNVSFVWKMNLLSHDDFGVSTDNLSLPFTPITVPDTLAFILSDILVGGTFEDGVESDSNFLILKFRVIPPSGGDYLSPANIKGRFEFTATGFHST